MQDESHLPTVFRKKLPPNLEKIKNGSYTPNDLDYPIHEYLKENNVVIDENGSEIVNFLRGKSILVTGATGFLGKLLVEKLLRSCKDIKKIYLIIRTKKGKSTETRVKEYLNNWVFIRLSEIYPDFREKVVGIYGDLEKFDLDISWESRKLIIENVNIIYHAAATVRFDEKLRPSVMINTNATREIIKIAKECRNLDVLCHVSTAYSNCVEKHIKEEFYQPFIDSDQLLHVVKRLTNEQFTKVSPGLMGKNLPNTYIFSKQIAEHLIQREAVGIPTCVVRPAIILPAVKEPVRGWIDTYLGVGGLMQSAAFGFTHIIPGRLNVTIPLVPADYVVNHCIAASYKTAKDKITDKTSIYNYTSAEGNSQTWAEYIVNVYHQAWKIGSTKTVFIYFITMTRYRFVFLFLDFLLHYLPAHIADWGLIIMGKKPRFVQVYNKLIQLTTMLPYFILHQWTFDMTNTKKLWNSLNEKDKRNFPFDMEALNWRRYFDVFIVAGRELALREFCDNLEEGRAHVKKINLISNALIASITVLSIYFFINTIFCFIPLTIIVIFFYYFIP